MTIRNPGKTSDVDPLFRYPAPLSIFSQGLALFPQVLLCQGTRANKPQTAGGQRQV